MGVLQVREFRLLLGAQGVSEIGDRMVPIALAFAVLELGGGAPEVGLVLACRLFPLVATLLIGGVVADRVSRRTVMVVADALRFLTQGVMAALLIGGAAELWMLALLAGLTGAAGGFFNPAATGVMPLIVPRELLQQANGMRATALSAGEIAGPVLAGVLIAGVGPGWARRSTPRRSRSAARSSSGCVSLSSSHARRRPSCSTCARAGASSPR